MYRRNFPSFDLVECGVLHEELNAARHGIDGDLLYDRISRKT